MAFFAKRAPSKPKPEPPAAPDSTRSLFSHAGGFLAQQKDRIERDKRKAEKKRREKEKAERKASTKRESPEEEEDKPQRKSDLKRRRISSKESEKLLALSGLPVGSNGLDSSDDEAAPPSTAAQVRRSPRQTRNTTDDYGLSKSRSKLNHVAAIPVDVLEDDVEITGIVAREAPPSSEGEDEFSDPELAEMSRNARRAARAQQAREKKAASSQADVARDRAETETDPRTGLPTPELHDPVITILISSNIPDTGALLIRRKMSQPLGKVRTAWCDKYKLSDQMREEVFLTFCGRRQYDSTTCQRLGLKVDAYGQVTREDARADEPHDQVHVEAFTEALYAEWKAEKARNAKQALVDSGIYEEEEEENPEPELEPKEIKIVIRAKGKEPFRLKVSPHHSIAKIIKVAKKNLHFSPDQAVRLEFDGEPLDPNDTVGDTEIEDMENVDMYLDN